MEKVMSMEELRTQLENDFEAFGPHVCLDKPGWKDNVSPEVAEAYENDILIPVWEDADSIEFDIEDVARTICEANGYDLVYVVDKVFDSPGLDVYVASMTITDGLNSRTSYHNVFNRF